MLTCTIKQDLGRQWVKAAGRVDGLTAPDIQQKMDELILNGARVLVADLEEVTYISSAGLRIFLAAQKHLMKVGGEIILYMLSENVFKVFESSGFTRLFKIAATREELESLIGGGQAALNVLSKEIDGLTVQYLEKEAAPCPLIIIGSHEKLATASYSLEDVHPVSPKELRFASGLATMGDDYEEYKHLFGEAMTINGHFFFYPAVKRPAVDFMLNSGDDLPADLKFFHGFGFNGDFKYVLLFEGLAGLVALPQLVNMCFEISSADILGVVFLAESKGFWGMNLKKVPILENRPPQGRDIFDPANFTEWMNFPVEPTDINHIVTGVGVAARDQARERLEMNGVLPKGQNFHLHAGVFSKEAISKRLDRFDDEIRRVLTELEAVKVQHVLGQSKFSSGLVGLVELTE
ncbi:MAG: STAS domain-containing protein [Deltaproteobacteria bacterium]|nr:STAS domain-containing protein [Deltaproteobacteria bacterium]